MARDNKNLNLRWIEAFNQRDWASEAACRTVDYRAYVSGAPGPLDSSGWEGFLAMFTTAFPDAVITVAASLEEDALVASSWTITGTHKGDFQGIAATGRPVTLPGVDMSRVVDGKIAEHWSQFDIIGLMQQLGAPSPD
jgi:steroid delta-isomerase-like uncharacterized protein